MNIGQSISHSKLEELLLRLNHNLVKSELDKLKEEAVKEDPNLFNNMSDLEVRDYFSSEISNLHAYTLEEAGESFLIGATFAIVYDSEGSPVASFVMTGHNINGAIYACCYLAEDAPEALKEN